MTSLRPLNLIRQWCEGARVSTKGLSNKLLKPFEQDPQLVAAVDAAWTRHNELQARYPELLKQDETLAINRVQSSFVNFYDPTTINSYVALAGRGPWVVTGHGAVIYDSGGYGMLGLGHHPQTVLSALARPQVMANIMTPNVSQIIFMSALRNEIGHTRPKALQADSSTWQSCPYEGFICLNSGSEAVSMAMRISDVDAKRMTSEGGAHEGMASCLVSLKGSFHGRTDRPAQATDSTAKIYMDKLSSFSSGRVSPLRTVIPNDVQHLKDTFAELEEEKIHPELMLMEPVMGEGNPGVAITREFYDTARELTDKHRSLLLVDSIQAGLRCYGSLSLMDAPGFQDADPPDFETFSKAIAAGQYPLSVLALGPRVPEIYVQGLYGNTMTTNPRALDVASAVLEELPGLRVNIREMGVHFKEALQELSKDFPEIVDVTGTGLLVAAHLDAALPVVGEDGIERRCREAGLGVIHGGKNALRFTPHFALTKNEVKLICDVLRDVLEQWRVEKGTSKAQQ